MIKDQIDKEELRSTLTAGLPDVAEDTNKKNPLVLVIIGAVIIVFLSAYFLARTKAKVTKPIEENYVLQKNTIKEMQVSSPQTKLKSQTQEEHTQNHEMTETQLKFLLDKQKELQQRLSAPLMLVNNSQSTARPQSNGIALPTDPNTQFMQQVTSAQSESVYAKSLGPLNAIIAEGSFIHAILESASNSDLPGYLRASVSTPSYSEDGSQVLIPVGSRLIGQYKSGMLQGQSRIFVVWTRLITPEGISINLGSPGVDSLGVAGMGADVIDRHFWQRFGMASLLSIIGAGTANINAAGLDKENSASQYRSAIANSFSQSANQSLQQNMMIAPTLETYQGKPIMVFVAHDLYFHDAIKQIKPKLNVF